MHRSIHRRVLLGAHLEDGLKLRGHKGREVRGAGDALLEEADRLMRRTGRRGRAAVDAHREHAAPKRVDVSRWRDRPRRTHQLHKTPFLSTQPWLCMTERSVDVIAA